MQFEYLLEIFVDLKNDESSAWNSCVKNHINNLAVIENAGESFIAPMNYVAHFRKNNSREKGSVNTGPKFEEIIQCLKTQGFSKVIRPAKHPSDQFLFYSSYYASLPTNDSSNIESRDSKKMEFWVKEIAAINNKDVEFDEIVTAFEEFDNNGIPDGFHEAKKWFVAHPNTQKPYPAKIIWGLATSQRGGDFTAHQARDALRKHGFECAALDPSDFAPDISQTEPLIEGTERQATRTIRERNPFARKRCIDRYRSQNGGRLACLACDIDFSEVYGKLGEGFIHVHHLDPLAEATGERIVSPEFDLVPVCPNCHAMIHRHSKTRSIAEIARLTRRKVN